MEERYRAPHLILNIIAILTITLNKMGLINGVGIMFTIVSCCIFPTIIILSLMTRVIAYLLRVKPFQLLGRASMDIYVWHFPVLILMSIICFRMTQEIPYKSAVFYIAYIAATIMISSFSYHCRSEIIKRRLKATEINYSYLNFRVKL